jgi:hypothetical protein
MRSMTQRNPRWPSDEGNHLCSMTHRRLGAAANVTARRLYARAGVDGGPSRDRCYDHVTLFMRDRVIAHVSSPVERAAAKPSQVLAWMDLHEW